MTAICTDKSTSNIKVLYFNKKHTTENTCFFATPVSPKDQTGYTCRKKDLHPHTVCPPTCITLSLYSYLGPNPNPIYTNAPTPSVLCNGHAS